MKPRFVRFIGGFAVGLLLALGGLATAQVGGPMIGQASLTTASITGGTIDSATITNSPISGSTLGGTTLTTTAGLSSLASATDTTPGTLTTWDTRHILFNTNSTTGKGVGISTNQTTGASYISAAQPGSAWDSLNFQAIGLNYLPSGGTAAWSSNSTDFVFNVTLRGQGGSAGSALALAGGAGSATTGGAVTITGGTATSGAGSAITITAGSGTGGTNAGGDVNLIPGAAVSTGTPGEVKINSTRGFFDTCWQQYLPASVPVTGTSYTFFMANRAYRVVAASIINSSTSTVPTVDVTKDTGTTAPGAGSTVLTGVMTFSATANTRVAGSIIATVATTNLAAGDRLAAKWAGTVGSITGAMVCVTLVPI